MVTFAIKKSMFSIEKRNQRVIMGVVFEMFTMLQKKPILSDF